MKLNVKRLTETAKLPQRAHDTDAGFDIYADEDVELTESQLVSTGIAIEIPDYCYGRLKGRSGLTSKTPLRVQEGTIDADYRGEIKVMCDIKAPYKINKGDRIAQLIIQELPFVYVVEVDELSDTDRGFGGFGSTGV